MIVVFGGNKCSGKSTTLCNVAVCLAPYQSTCILDSDKQKSTTKWFNRRKANKLNTSNIEVFQHYGNVAEKLTELNKQFDCVFVDVAGINSSEFISALGVADLAVVTLEPTIKVLETLTELDIQQKMIKKINPNLKYAFTQVRTKISFSASKRRDFFLSNLKKYPFGKIFNTVIFDRDSFFVSDEIGGTVFETKDKKAQNEIELLSKELVGYINK